MSEPSYKGGLLLYEEHGILYNITFRYEEFQEEETGIWLAKIRDLEVTDASGRDCYHEINVDRANRFANDHVSNVIMNRMRL